MGKQPMWFFEDEGAWEDSGIDRDSAVPPIARGDTACPLALPVTLGDRITIHYPEDPGVAVQGNPEVWHYGGFRKDGVQLVSEEQHEGALRNAEHGRMPTIHGKMVEGVYLFNERLMKHATRVEVDHVEVPDFYNVR